MVPSSTAVADVEPKKTPVRAGTADGSCNEQATHAESGWGIRAFEALLEVRVARLVGKPERKHPVIHHFRGISAATSGTIFTH
jgi:hypothetical protein